MRKVGLYLVSGMASIKKRPAGLVFLVLPLHFPTGRFWLRDRLQHLPLCGIRKRPL
jgi:hypothetical protein